jgi:hypothetical protein
MASPTWAGMVLQLASELRVSPHFSMRQQGQGWEGVWLQLPDRPDIVVNRVFCMKQVAVLVRTRQMLPDAHSSGHSIICAAYHVAEREED